MLTSNFHLITSIYSNKDFWNFKYLPRTYIVPIVLPILNEHNSEY